MNKKLIVVAALLFLACSKEQEPAIKPDVPLFFKVYSTFIELSQTDSLRTIDESVLMDSALAKHHMNPAQFDTTLKYLERNPQIFLKAFEQFDDSMRAQMGIRSVD